MSELLPPTEPCL